jgi:hypothetical protein
MNLDDLTLERMIALRDDLVAAIADRTSGRHAAVPKPFAIRSDALTASAKGQDCTLRLPGVCNHDPSTTVFAHYPGSKKTGPKGTSAKGHDLHGGYACSACHDYIDGRNHPAMIFRLEDIMLPPALSDAIILDAMLRSLDETHYLMVRAGLISVKGFP